MRRGSNRGLTMIEVVVVIAIIAIIAAITIPGVLRFRMVSNERATTASLRTLVNSNIVFQDLAGSSFGTQDYWTGDVAGLVYLQNPGIDPANYSPLEVLQDHALAAADLAPMPQGAYDPVYHNGLPAGTTATAKSGYWYVMLRSFRHASTTGTGDLMGAGYGYAAAPARYGRTGENFLIANEEATIQYIDWIELGGDTSIDGGEFVKVDGVIADWPFDDLPWTIAQ